MMQFYFGSPNIDLIYIVRMFVMINLLILFINVIVKWEGLNICYVRSGLREECI